VGIRKGSREQACPERSRWRSLSQRRGQGDKVDKGDKGDKGDKVEIFTPMPNAPCPLALSEAVGAASRREGMTNAPCPIPIFYKVIVKLLYSPFTITTDIFMN
jgi:hypothetical protein